MAKDGPNVAKDDPKMVQRGAKRASRWPQDGSAQAFGAILGYLWAMLGPFRGQLRAILGHFGVKILVLFAKTRPLISTTGPRCRETWAAPERLIALANSPEENELADVAHTAANCLQHSLVQTHVMPWLVRHRHNA